MFQWEGVYKDHHGVSLDNDCTDRLTDVPPDDPPATSQMSLGPLGVSPFCSGPFPSAWGLSNKTAPRAMSVMMPAYEVTDGADVGSYNSPDDGDDGGGGDTAPEFSRAHLVQASMASAGTAAEDGHADDAAAAAAAAAAGAEALDHNLMAESNRIRELVPVTVRFNSDTKIPPVSTLINKSRMHRKYGLGPDEKLFVTKVSLHAVSNTSPLALTATLKNLESGHTESSVGRIAVGDDNDVTHLLLPGEHHTFNEPVVLHTLSDPESVNKLGMMASVTVATLNKSTADMPVPEDQKKNAGKFKLVASKSPLGLLVHVNRNDITVDGKIPKATYGQDESYVMQKEHVDALISRIDKDQLSKQPASLPDKVGVAWGRLHASPNFGDTSTEPGVSAKASRLVTEHSATMLLEVEMINPAKVRAIANAQYKWAIEREHN